MFHPGKIKTYKPVVSDVSDDELMETVKELEKSRNVIAPTPAPARSMPFDIFKTNRGRDLVPLGNLLNHHRSINLTP